MLQQDVFVSRKLAVILFIAGLLFMSGCDKQNLPMDSAKAESLKTESVKTGATKTDQVVVETATRDTATRDTAKTDVAKTDDAKSEGLKTGAMKIETPKAKREPIYVEAANGRELIDAALVRAKREHKHVLIEWGGNWCGWCYKLHDVFRDDPLVRPLVHEEFELVLIDQGKNLDLMYEYGGKDRQYSYPHLTILDWDGKVLTNEKTDPLEEGAKHSPQLVSTLLKAWTPAKVDAESLLASALLLAKMENKRVLVRAGDPYCGWCKVLSQFLAENEAVMAIDYVDVKIDTLRMTSGKELAAKWMPKGSQGVPWMTIMDESGTELANSVGPQGNIGYPSEPSEIAHFADMLNRTKQRMTDAEVESLVKDLNDRREQRMAKSRNQ
ncbi:MAG: thioredoxin family protein [Pirellula sp.]